MAVPTLDGAAWPALVTACKRPPRHGWTKAKAAFSLAGLRGASTKTGAAVRRCRLTSG